MSEGKVLLDGLAFGEGPRWRGDRLYFSDMHAQQVISVDERGARRDVVRVPGLPSGLGWLPDGRMLIVSMTDQSLLRLEGDGTLARVADLKPLTSYHANDMVVDARGRAYVGNFGFDLHTQAAYAPAELVLVEPDGSARVVADDLAFPNGAVITPDGRSLILAESMGARLSAFDVAEDGTLSGRRVWASLENAVPDGICLDAEGGVWVASPNGAGVLRVVEGGEVTERLEVETQAYACMLGGADGRTLFVCTSPTHDPEQCRQSRSGRIEAFRVRAPHAGLP